MPLNFRFRYPVTPGGEGEGDGETITPVSQEERLRRILEQQQRRRDRLRRRFYAQHGRDMGGRDGGIEVPGGGNIFRDNRLNRDIFSGINQLLLGFGRR